MPMHPNNHILEDLSRSLERFLSYGDEGDLDSDAFRARYSHFDFLRQLLGQHPKSVYQKRHQAVIEELVRNGFPYLALDIETVQLLGSGYRAERLRSQLLAGYPVDKILRDRGSWYVTFQYEDCALRAAKCINSEQPIVSVHYPPVIPTNTPARYSYCDTTTGNSYTTLARGEQSEYNLILARTIFSVNSFSSEISTISGRRRVLDLRTNKGKRSAPETTPDERAHAGSSSSIITTVQDLILIPKRQIGRGSQSIVYRGLLRGRTVAIKRVWDTVAANREIEILKELGTHPNIAHYYYHEARPPFTYLAMELCSGSLVDYIVGARRDRYTSPTAGYNAIKQISAGIGHLHAYGIVHRDLKPENILLKRSRIEEAGYRVVITDFGLSIKLKKGEDTFLVTDMDELTTGTPGWRAPEILEGLSTLDRADGGELPRLQITLTNAVDIFASGCLFHYILAGGKHPFGDPDERERNILNDVTYLEDLDSKEALDLIEWMLAFDAEDRPDTSGIMLHPYFWSAAKRMNFLQDVSDHLENLRQKPASPILEELERSAHRVIGTDWSLYLDQCFVDTHRKRIEYNVESVQDLLRTIRNNKHHYHELPANVKERMGYLPHGFLGYFTDRFPYLFMHVYDIVNDFECLRDSPDLRVYFDELD